MRVLYVPLERAAIQKLIALAEKEKRRPQDQAAYLLESVLLNEDKDRPRESTQAPGEDCHE